MKKVKIFLDKKNNFYLLLFIALILIFNLSLFATGKNPIPQEKINYYKDVLKFGTINDLKKILAELIIYDCRPLIDELIQVLLTTNDIGIKSSVLSIIKDIQEAKDKVKPYIIMVINDKFSDSSLLRLVIIAAGNYKIIELEDKIFEIFNKKEYETEIELRKACIESLGNMLSTKYMEQIFNFYIDTKNNADLRAICALYFSKFDSIKKEYIEKMNQIVADKAENSIVRRFTIYALSKFGDQSSFEALIAALKSDDPYIQIYAAQAIKKYNADEAKKVIFELIRSNNSKVRLEVVKVLGEFNAIEYIEAIIYLSLYDSDNNVKKEARDVFLKMISSLSILNFSNEIKEKIRYLLDYISKYDPSEDNRNKAKTLLQKFFPN
ncbi:MAG: HEAT repeat domain-containing protein [Spirochaetes bacterium]|nr:HEAT repeat domain-containing protein [Spirochaetota bacterium]